MCQPKSFNLLPRTRVYGEDDRHVAAQFREHSQQFPKPVRIIDV